MKERIIYDAIGFGALNVDRLGWVPQVLLDGETVVKREIRAPGGSAANTIAVLAELELRTAYIGAVGNDQEAKILLKDFHKRGVDLSLIKVMKGGSGLVLGLEDSSGNRPHYIWSGVNSLLSKKDIPTPAQILTKFLHLSSFVDQKQLDLQIKVVSRIDPDIRVSVAPGMVYAQLGFSRIKALLDNCHYIFMTEQELTRLFEREGLAQAKRLLNPITEAVVITIGHEGCYLLSHKEEELVPAFTVEGEVFPTGAGDAFAAGFLYGQFMGFDFLSSALAGNLLASYCVQEMGARKGFPSRQGFDERLEGIIHESE